MPATQRGVIAPDNLSFIRASDIGDQWGLNLLVYGPAGVGKTTFAASAQDVERGKDVLIIDVEGGSRSLADRTDITLFRPASIREIQQVYEWLLDDESHSYKTVVLDSLTETQALGLKDIMRSSRTPDMPGLQDYGKSNEQITRLVRAFKGLAQQRGINVIFTALAREERDEATGIVLTRPALTARAADLVVGAVDAVGYLTTEQTNTESKRVLLLQPTAKYVAKIRQPRSGPQIPGRIENPTFQMLLDQREAPTAPSRGVVTPASTSGQIRPRRSQEDAPAQA